MKRERSRFDSGQRAGFFVALTILTIFVTTPSALRAQNDKAKKRAPINHEPSAGSNAAQAAMAAQAPLLAVANEIKKLDPKGIGLGGLRINVDQHTLEVWWKGQPPPEVRRIAESRSSAEVNVVLQPSHYSQRELIESARAIVAKATEYPGLVSAGPLVDGSGLEIGVEDIARASSLKFAVPVRLVARKAIVLLTRANDTPPFWAGAVTRAAKPGAGACTTGFAMSRGSTRGLLTADHCGCGGNLIFNNGAGVPIGVSEPSANNNLFTDSQFIIGNSGPAIYDGGVGVGEFSKPVVGEQTNVVGMLTCTSGADSGVHCGIHIDSVNNAFSIPGALCSTFPFVEGVSIAHQIDGTVATSIGDSGGPVFTLAADPSTVNAAGMMFGGMTPTACGSFGTTCFNVVAFHDIDTLKSSHNVNVVTSGGPVAGGGGATVVSMLVFAGATLLSTLLWLRRRTKLRSAQMHT